MLKLVKHNVMDFYNQRSIIRYLVIYLIVLLGGAVAKDGFAILMSLLIIVYLCNNRVFRSIEYWLIWFFAYGFYTGLGLIKIEPVAKYIAKPSFLLFIIFLAIFHKVPDRIKNSKFSILWLIFLGLSLLSILFHKQSPFILITYSSFFFVYYILRSGIFTVDHCRSLLNLFIATAILQTLTCVMQVAQLIPPASKMMDDGSGAKMEWVAGLDDVATGTFGAVSGHVVSWYVSMIALFCILVWTVTRKSKYLIVAAIAFLQFATIDSKTIMGVMLAMMGFLYYYLVKNRKKVKMPVHKLASFAVMAGVMGLVLFTAWDFYYSYQNKAGGTESRGSFNDVYESEIKASRQLIIDNIDDWGKIKGFSYVMDDFKTSGPFDMFWGYGLMGYSFNGKMSLIESKDTPLMQLNNFTRSRSTLIIQFATCGFLGFALFIMAMYQWYRYNIAGKDRNRIDIVQKSLVKIFLPFTLLATFIYDMPITTITVVTFAAITAVLKNYSESIKQHNINIWQRTKEQYLQQQ